MRRIHVPFAVIATALCALLSSAHGCKRGESSATEKHERALRKTIIGGESGKPIMGQFVLKRGDAKKVSDAQSKSSRIAFERTGKEARGRGPAAVAASDETPRYRESPPVLC